MTAARLNRWLDSLPRSHLLLGGRLVPAWLALGGVGALIGALVHLLLVARTGGAVGRAVLADVACAAVFVGWGLVRQRLTGEERTVLLEHALLTGAVAAAILGLDQLDAWVPGMCVLLAFGRIGCTVGGCCYGTPAAVGLVYPGGHPACGPRRAPVQLAETALWSGLAVAAVALQARPPGTAAGAALAAYGGARLALEALRDDPHDRGMARGLAALAAVLGLGLLAVAHPGANAAALVVAVILAAGVWATRGRWLRRADPLGPGATEALARAGARLREGDRVVDAGPLAVVCAPEVHGTFVSVRRPDGPPLSPAEARVALAVVAANAGSPDGLAVPVEVAPGLFVAAWPPTLGAAAWDPSPEAAPPAPTPAGRPALTPIELDRYLHR